MKKRFLTLPEILSIHEFLSGWFHGAPFDAIYRDNVLAYIAYVFHDKDYADLSAQVHPPLSFIVFISVL